MTATGPSIRWGTEGMEISSGGKKGGSHLATEDEFGGCQAAGRNSLLGVNQVGGKQRGDNQPVVVRSVPFQRR